MKTGVSSYSFSQYINKGKMDIFDTVKKAKELGFDAIEFITLPEISGKTRQETALELKKLAKDEDIEISAYVVGGNLICENEEDRKKQLDILKEEVDLASTLGVKLFRHDVGYQLPMNMCFDEALIIAAPIMREVAEYANSLGIKSMIENHGRAFQDADRMERTVSAVNHKNFSLLVDIGNFMCADEDTVLSVSRVANLAAHVHMKDFVRKDFYSNDGKEKCYTTRGCNYLLGVAVGSGDAKAAQCISILKQAGYDGYLDIEFEGPSDCIEELKKGLSFVRSCLTA